jgi:hypothetical protein
MDIGESTNFGRRCTQSEPGPDEGLIKVHYSHLRMEAKRNALQGLVSQPATKEKPAGARRIFDRGPTRSPQSRRFELREFAVNY